MADAGAGRHDAEILEGLLAPFEEAVALLVLLIFALDVLAERARVAEEVDHDRVVDDEIDGHQRVDLRRVAAELFHGVAHGREIDDGRHAGEILHQHARRAEGDLMLLLAAMFCPGRGRLDIGLLHRTAVLVAQQVLEHDLHREGQIGDARKAVLLGLFQREIDVKILADFQGLAAVEAVERL